MPLGISAEQPARIRRKENELDTSMIRWVCAVLAIVFVTVIVLRRRQKTD